MVTGNVALGGMRAITFVQAFQYWLKLTALAVPVIFLVLHWQADGRPGRSRPGRADVPGRHHRHREHAATLTVTDRSTARVDGPRGRRRLPVDAHRGRRPC